MTLYPIFSHASSLIILKCGYNGITNKAIRKESVMLRTILSSLSVIDFTGPGLGQCSKISPLCPALFWIVACAGASGTFAPSSGCARKYKLICHCHAAVDITQSRQEAQKRKNHIFSFPLTKLNQRKYHNINLGFSFCSVIELHKYNNIVDCRSNPEP